MTDLRAIKRLFAFSCVEALPYGLSTSTVLTERDDHSETHFVVIDSMQVAHRFAGLSFRYMLIDPLIPEDVQAYLRALNRWHEPENKPKRMTVGGIVIGEVSAGKFALSGGNAAGLELLEEILSRLESLESRFELFESRMSVIKSHWF